MFERSVADRLRRGTRSGLLLLGALAAAGVVRAAVPRPSSAPNDPVVARVEDKSIRLSEVQDLQKRNQERYRRETGKPAPGAFDTFFLRAGLEEAVRMRLVELDARAQGYAVSDAAAESTMKLQSFFTTAGRFDPTKFDAYRAQNPKSFAEAREQARALLLYQRRMRNLERELTPSAADLAQLARSKDLRARVRYLLISDIHYDGVHDPTDDELRAFYEKEKSDLSRPAELAYTAASVPLPAVGSPAAARARAAELLAAAQAGAPFESLLTAPGVVSTSGVWRPGATGLLAAGSAAQEALAFPAGTILPRLVESSDAVAIVRVDRTSQGNTPSLEQVAVDLRARWRAQKIQAEETNAARAYYDAHPDSFTSDAWSVRWARIDSSKATVRSPKDSDLAAWYEGHRAEFARLDPSGGGIQTRSFAEVRPQVEQRWRAEQRAFEARRIADELATAWAKGKSGSSARAIVESGGPAWIVTGGALPPGLPRVLADSARSWTDAPRALVVGDPSGFSVVGLVRHEPRYKTAFEVVEPKARERAFDERIAADQAGARDWYESHKDHFTTGPGYAIVWAVSGPPPPAQVDVPPSKIAAYYRDHAADLGTPPQVHVRHILVATDKRSEPEARTLATRFLARVRGGENFQQLARMVSDDPATKEDGGDLGFIRRGATVPPFEKAAFALTDAQPLSGLVRTQFGYHIIQLVERREGTVPPLEQVRGEIGNSLALQYADTLARINAQQMLAEAKSYDDLLAKADGRKMATQLTRWYEGQALTGPAILDEVRADAPHVAPKGMFPRVYKYLTMGYAVAALDSVMPPRQLSFEDSRDRALQEKQRERGILAAKARADRLEHDLKAGVPWEKAIETAGGQTETRLMPRGTGLPTLGQVDGLDALLYGPGTDTLAVGDWRRIATPRGDVFVQLLERSGPDVTLDPAARQATLNAVLNRRLYDYIETLRAKYAVKVLRADLAERIPPPPEI